MSAGMCGGMMVDPLASADLVFFRDPRPISSDGWTRECSTEDALDLAEHIEIVRRHFREDDGSQSTDRSMFMFFGWSTGDLHTAIVALAKEVLYLRKERR